MGFELISLRWRGTYKLYLLSQPGAAPYTLFGHHTPCSLYLNFPIWHYLPVSEKDTTSSIQADHYQSIAKLCLNIPQGNMNVRNRVAI